MYLRINYKYANLSRVVYKFDKVLYQKRKTKLPVNKRFLWLQMHSPYNFSDPVTIVYSSLSNAFFQPTQFVTSA